MVYCRYFFSHVLLYLLDMYLKSVWYFGLMADNRGSVGLYSFFRKSTHSSLKGVYPDSAFYKKLKSLKITIDTAVLKICKLQMRQGGSIIESFL